MSFTETSREYVIVLTIGSCFNDTRQSNILVDESGHARIADFGLATITRGVNSELSTSGDEGHGARWAAPEVLTDQGAYSKEADVFSFAMVMSQVCHRLSTTGFY
jgi:serine/threonine protein kinase